MGTILADTGTTTTTMVLAEDQGERGVAFGAIVDFLVGHPMGLVLTAAATERVEAKRGRGSGGTGGGGGGRGGGERRRHAYIYFGGGCVDVFVCK